MNDFCLQVEDLTVCYDDIFALKNISFAIPPANMVGVLGPNGAGKSTLLKTIVGALKPSLGSISLLGQPVKKVLKKIAYIPQRDSIDWSFPITVFQVVLMGCYRHMGFLKIPKKEDKERVYLALKQVKMADVAHRQIGQLSIGQRQRMFLARALVQNPDVFFLDEPFEGIDCISESMILELLYALKKEGKTFFIVHHDLCHVQEIFDWLILLNIELVAYGKTEDVLKEENFNSCFGKRK